MTIWDRLGWVKEKSPVRYNLDGFKQYKYTNCNVTLRKQVNESFIAGGCPSLVSEFYSYFLYQITFLSCHIFTYPTPNLQKIKISKKDSSTIIWINSSNHSE